MTLMLLQIDNQLQCIVGLTFVTGTKHFLVTTQSTNNNQITTFICSPESAHYPFIEKLYSRTLPRITLKVRTENFKRLFATDFFILGDLECGDEELIIIN